MLFYRFVNVYSKEIYKKVYELEWVVIYIVKVNVGNLLFWDFVFFLVSVIISVLKVFRSLVDVNKEININVFVKYGFILIYFWVLVFILYFFVIL